MRHPEFVRHIGSLLLAAVFGPAVFLLTGTGLSAFETARRVSFVDDPLSPAAALGALLLAGLLYGILAMARLSPLGPGLTGLAFLGMSGWALAAPASYEAAFKQLDVHMGGAVGQWGLGFLLGVPLVATLTSPRRWRKKPHQVQAYPPPAQPQDPYQYQYQYPVDPTLPDIAAPSLRYPAAMPVTPHKPPVPSASAAPTAIIPPPAPPAPAASPARPAQAAPPARAVPPPQAAAPQIVPPAPPQAAPTPPAQAAARQAAPSVPSGQPQPAKIEDDATVKIDSPKGQP